MAESAAAAAAAEEEDEEEEMCEETREKAEGRTAGTTERTPCCWSLRRFFSPVSEQMELDRLNSPTAASPPTPAPPTPPPPTTPRPTPAGKLSSDEEDDAEFLSGSGAETPEDPPLKPASVQPSGESISSEEPPVF